MIRSAIPGGNRAATVRRYPAFFLLTLRAVFSCFHTDGYEAYSLTTDGYGIFNVRTKLGACRSQEGGVRRKSAQELKSERQKNCPSPCPTRGSIPGSEGTGFCVQSFG